MKYADILGVYEHFQPVHGITNESIVPYHLIAAAIEKKVPSEWEKLRKRNLESNLKFDLLIHRLLVGNERISAIKAMKGVFPIHPYSVYLLIFIARYFGSTKQALHNFLHDGEKGFLIFIRECPQNERDYFFTADYLWDYFTKSKTGKKG